MAAILHVYAGSLTFMEGNTFALKSAKEKYIISKRKGKYFYTFDHFDSEKSSKRAQIFAYMRQIRSAHSWGVKNPPKICYK